MSDNYLRVGENLSEGASRFRQQREAQTTETEKQEGKRSKLVDTE